MDKIVHGILIDPVNRAINVVRLDGDHLEAAYRHIGCETIEPVRRYPNNDVLFVDEDARISGKPQTAFMFDGQVFLGRGLIVNEPQGEEDWTAPRSPFIELISKIVFQPPEVVPPFTVADILTGLVGGKFRPMAENDFDAFADCLPGSLIAWDFAGWTVLVCPGDSEREGAISVHAYKFASTEPGSQDLAYQLVQQGWEAL